MQSFDMQNMGGSDEMSIGPTIYENLAARQENWFHIYVPNDVI